MRRLLVAVVAGWTVLAVLGAVAATPAMAAGQVLVFYQVDHDPGATSNSDIMVQRLTGDGQVGWDDGAAPHPVAATPRLEHDPVSCTDGRSGAYVAWLASAPGPAATAATELLVQHVDGKGQPQWQGTGTSVAPPGTRPSEPQLVPVGDGSVIVVFTSLGADGDSDVLAQHLAADGRPLWVWDAGRMSYAGNSSRPERHPRAVATGDGGVIVVFEWEDVNGTTDLMAQCLGADGLPRWNEGKQAVDVAAGPTSESRASVVSDGSNGALLVFARGRGAGDEVAHADLVAQHLTASGKLAWQGPEGVVVASGLPLQSPLALTDAATGQRSLVVAYWQPPGANSDNPRTQLLAQRLNGEGEPQWNGGQGAVVAALKNRVVSLQGTVAGSRPVIVFGVEFVTEEHQGDVLLAAQCLDREGAARWAEGRYVRLSKTYQRELAPCVLDDGDNGVIVVFERQASGAPADANTDLLAYRLSAQGALLWNAPQDGVVVAEEAGRETNVSLVPGDF